jgi:cell division protein FtsB
MLLLALFGSRGLVQTYKLKEERNRTRMSNAKLQEENRKLSEQIAGLRNNKEEVEKAARELGFVRRGELVYQFEK